MLDAHGYCMQENTIEALRLVKDEVLRVCSVMKVNITTDLILEVKGAYGKYIADLEQKKAMEDAIKWDKEKMNNDAKKNQEGKSLQETIDGDIRHCENSIKTADELFADANVTVQKALSAKNEKKLSDRNVVQNA